MRAPLFAVAGLLFGSFLTVLVHRLPRPESMADPGSGCPRCGTPLGWRDSVPLVSPLIPGKCRSCGARISLQGPVLQVGTALLFAAASLVWDPLFPAILVASFLGVMLAVALVDARWRIVPNRLVYPALLVYGGTILAGDLAGAGVDVVRGLPGMAAYGGALLVVALIAPRGMGMGDVKLAALIGLVLGSLSLAFVAVAAFVGLVGGGIGALTAVVFLGYRRTQQIPFGPFLAGGAAVAALAAPVLIRAYVSLVGG
jgi:leader peptidase (prepilin peptidase)/N-methyltransferase